MDVSTFFTRLLQAPNRPVRVKATDDINDFDHAWEDIKHTLEHPDERQLVRGIESTDVPKQLTHIVDALVYEANRTDEDTTGVCLEYFLKNDLLANLERLCEPDRPHGIKGEVLRAINNLVVLLSERFLVHNAVHRPLRRLLRSCVGDEPEEKVDGRARVVGAAGLSTKDRHDGDARLEEDLVDLMCILCSRMRAYPPLLLIFFHDKGWLQPRSAPDHERVMSPTPSSHTRASSKVTHHFEFLLFSYLLRFVHRENRTGDFARAGLLFLFDIAFLSPEESGDELSMRETREGNDPLQDARDALGEFILDGDFADVMAAGLGAIWSLLPSKLRIPTLAAQASSEEGLSASTSGGMHLGAGDGETDNIDQDEIVDLPSSAEPEIREQLDLLLKLFGFLQDIIHRCNSSVRHADPNSSAVTNTQVLGSAVADATLDAIQASFLDNVLYPSIMESSNIDGSSVAVMTYLDVMLSNLDDGPLLDRILDHLMDSLSDLSSTRQTRGTLRSPMADYPSDDRFTLKDLLLDNLGSDNTASRTTALRLLNTLLSEHCQHSVRGLLSPIRISHSNGLPRKNYNTAADMQSESLLPTAINSKDNHLQELELYGSLISRIDPLQTSTELAAGYAGYLTDMQAKFQADRCYVANRVSLQISEDGEKEFLFTGETNDTSPQHRLNPNDKLVRTIIEELSRFFCHPPDENVALTGVLTSLTLCANRSLAGWMLYDLDSTTDPWSKPVKPQSIISDTDSDHSLDDLPVTAQDDAVSDPFTAQKLVDLPALYQVLRDLVRQIATFRQTVPDFDRLLSERRQGLLFADHLDEAMNIMLDVEPTSFGLPAAPASPQPKKRPSVVGKLASFLTPRKKSPNPATPNSKPSTPVSLREAAGKVTSSPFKSHYEQVSGVALETVPSASPIATGPWSPAKPLRSTHTGTGATSTLASSVIDSAWTDEDGVSDVKVEDAHSTKVTLSTVLDNCVVLEEYLKEVVSVITARRSLGIDQVGFI
ncbi:Retinoic acid induced 16-like protein-domain-containing protein [Naematelia encephala]|uniref:Retinoic acid induced 16-like protein-domain-containing protein n=1 Tax=Naematelia encephala TaxID=71784 RepID=A0A1Y2B1Y9_9TREE|nr:Retinoic acid induced 16-like protein-domain-containing protein [Naematelia encephala]